jgi:Cd2+/Zn2+-exporting ATPase
VLRFTGLESLPTELVDGPAGATLAVVGRERQILGAIYLADEPRSDARESIAELRDLRLEQLVMLTGDSQATADRIAAELGIQRTHAELLPQDKVRVVQQLVTEYGGVAMVGDGVNDAPALAAARLGIALGTQASDTALETADIVSLSSHLRRIPQLVRLGQRTRDILGQNIAFALTIKLGVLLLALVGLGTLWAAVVADVGASMLVLFNAMRLLRPVELPATSVG